MFWRPGEFRLRAEREVHTTSAPQAANVADSASVSTDDPLHHAGRRCIGGQRAQRGAGRELARPSLAMRPPARGRLTLPNHRPPPSELSFPVHMSVTLVLRQTTPVAMPVIHPVSSICTRLRVEGEGGGLPVTG
jgi:hypothetical protein